MSEFVWVSIAEVRQAGLWRDRRVRAYAAEHRGEVRPPVQSTLRA